MASNALDLGEKSAKGDTKALKKLVAAITVLVAVGGFIFALVWTLATNAGSSVRMMLTGAADQASSSAQNNSSDYGTSGGGL